MLKCVLWDFGDTLADERWMLRELPGVPDWAAAWSEIAGRELADHWNRGDVSLHHVIGTVAERLAIAPSLVRAHVELCCAQIRFFAAPFAMARRVRLRQALVTINPDGFSELVVPRYNLESLFKPIVTSWQERTLDKAQLCLRALQQVGPDIEPGEALLIDNKLEWIDAWSAHGGRTYLFRGEIQFTLDLPGDLRELSSAAA